MFVVVRQCHHNPSVAVASKWPHFILAPPCWSLPEVLSLPSPRCAAAGGVDPAPHPAQETPGQDGQRAQRHFHTPAEPAQRPLRPQFAGQRVTIPPQPNLSLSSEHIMPLSP